MSMSYVNAAVTAPASLTPAGYSFFRSIFDHVFATYDAHATGTADKHKASHILPDGALPLTQGRALSPANQFQANDMLARMWLEVVDGDYTAGNFATKVVPTTLSAINAALTAATAAATPLTHAKRDANAGISVGYLQAIAQATGDVVSARALTVGQYVFVGKGTGGATNFTVTDSGAVVTNSSVTAAAGFVGNLTGTATGLTAPATLTTLIADYRPTPGTAGLVNVAAGGPWRDAAGLAVAGATAATVSLPTQPTGTHTQYVAITKAPTTGALVRTDGAVDDPLTNLVLPVANKPVAVVLLRGATTNPGYVVAAGDIMDIRFSDTGGGTGTGGTDSIARAGSFLYNGPSTATFPNVLDVTNSAANVNIHPNLLRRTATSATGDDLQQHWVDPTLPGDVQKTGASTIFLNGTTNNPTYIKDKKVTNSPTATATSGAASVQRAIFDAALNSGAGGLVTPMPKADTLSAGQTMLARYWWDGSVLQDGSNQTNSGGFVDLTPLGSMQSQQIALSTAQFVDRGTTEASAPVNGAAGAIPNAFFPGGTIYVPAQCHMEWALGFSLTYAAAGTTPSLSLQLFLTPTGGTQLPQAPVWTVTNGGTYAGSLSSVVPVLLAPNSYTVGLAYTSLAGTGSTVTFFGNSVKLYMKFWM